MNLLAEHGPQDLEQAWMYFKHWVKGRPLSDAVSLGTPRPEGRTMEHRSIIGNRMPEAMYNADMEQKQGTLQVGVRQQGLPPYGMEDGLQSERIRAITADKPSPVDAQQGRLDMMMRAAREIQAREALTGEQDETASSLRAVASESSNVDTARLSEVEENIEGAQQQLNDVAEQLENDATRARFDPERSGEELVVNDRSNTDYISRQNERIDLAAAQIRAVTR